MLALGSPAGLLLLRLLLDETLSPTRALTELARDPVTYAYLTVSTTVAFGTFGFLLGRAADRLRRSSETDPLTHLWNRRRFQEQLELELHRARRYGSLLSLLLVDVDRLKEINDSGGHEAGDAALRQVAQALSQSSRKADVAARWGGDEFVLLAPGVDAAAARTLAERIRTTLAGLAGSPARPPTLSIGVADTKIAGADDSRQLIAAADQALYAAKAAGRNRSVVSTMPPPPDRRAPPRG